MLIIPLLEGVTFWILLRNPCAIPKNDSEISFTLASMMSSDDIECASENCGSKFTFGDKIRYMPSLLKYMVPFLLIFLFEYFINQGLVSMQLNCYGSFFFPPKKALEFLIPTIAIVVFFFSWNLFISKTFGLIKMLNIGGFNSTIRLACSFRDRQSI